jgi:hypothetical protein
MALGAGKLPPIGGEEADDRYLAEFDFRYNDRGDPARTEAALRGIVGKRLTYRDSSAWPKSP